MALEKDLGAKAADLEHTCLGAWRIEQSHDCIPMVEQATKLLPLAVFGVAERKDVRRVVNDCLSLSSHDSLLEPLAYAENCGILRENRHAPRRYVCDPPLVAFLGALHLGVYVVLKVRGDPVVLREAIDRVSQGTAD
ncbi:MAG TPA: hypothetical protein VK756_01915 [Solirubrobacteraceae bacterium]|nr:hypothetical protein [Solirubrobacteraceae bacterium]